MLSFNFGCASDIFVFFLWLLFVCVFFCLLDVCHCGVCLSVFVCLIDCCCVLFLCFNVVYCYLSFSSFDSGFGGLQLNVFLFLGGLSFVFLCFLHVVWVLMCVWLFDCELLLYWLCMYMFLSFVEFVIYLYFWWMFCDLYFALFLFLSDVLWLLFWIVCICLIFIFVFSCYFFCVCFVEMFELIWLFYFCFVVYLFFLAVLPMLLCSMIFVLYCVTYLIAYSSMCWFLCLCVCFGYSWLWFVVRLMYELVILWICVFNCIYCVCKY